MKKDIKILELFSGIGGFSLGFQRAGFNLTDHYFSEINPHSIANYLHNFKKSQHVGSVTDVRGSGLSPDIITFGSPCQDFSLVGKRKGMEGQRSSLILEAIRLIKECRPSVFIWENVKGTFSSNDGADFWGILAAFADIGGYRLEWQLLNTSWFLPQNRERIYLVGHLADRSEPGIFPITAPSRGTNEGTIKTPNIRTLMCTGNSGGHHSGMTLVKQKNTSETFGVHPSQQDRVYDVDGLSPTISPSLSGRQNIEVTNFQGKKICNTIRSGGRGSISNKHNWDVIRSVATPARKTKSQNGSRFKENDSFTLCTEPHGIQIGTTIRRLTEVECERLQGFPDDWTKFGIYNGVQKEVSKTQRYNMLGNAVTADVVEAIASKIKIQD